MGRAWRMAAIGASLMGLAGCSLILDFGGDVVDGGPGAGIDSGTPAIDGGDYCDTLEPNNAQATAIPIEPGVLTAAICPTGDRDFYSFSVNGAQDVVIELRFDNMGGLGDLDMLLYSETGAELMPKGNGFGNVERIERTETSEHGRLPAGNYAVQAFAFDNQRENDYELELTIEPPAGGEPDAGPTPDAGPPDAAAM